uniref:Methyltransferase type 11 domain-containing protein n=1 Tax=Fagus sylvatica TaxID=28930 RepID=A0A2N9ILV0_FAGSY
MLMLYNVLRVSRCLYQSPKALSLLTLVHSLCHSEIFSTVREVNIKGASSLSTLVCDGESQIPQSQTVSSLRSLVLDAGCGNGKYLGLNPDCFFVGCDISAPLIQICADRGHEVLVADAVNLPYKTGFGDASISIAVLHHLSTEIRRKKAIEELVRVVKKGSGSPRARSPSALPLESIPESEENGSREHHTTNQQEYFVPWHLPYHHAEVSGASACALANGLAKKDDKKGAVVYNRYYHVFSEGELER